MKLEKHSLESEGGKSHALVRDYSEQPLVIENFNVWPRRRWFRENQKAYDVASILIRAGPSSSY
jgi:hypothetical protein